VESVTPHAGLMQVFGQCIALRELGIRAVKRRVEAGDLRQLRRPFEKAAHRRQVVRLMQRGEWNQLFECGHHARIDEHRPRVFKTAVHNTMSHSDETIASELGAQKRDQIIERAVMTERRPFGPALLRCRCPVAVLGDEARCGVDFFNLAAHLQFEIMATIEKERKLDAGRPCVHDDDCIGHIRAPLATPVTSATPVPSISIQLVSGWLGSLTSTFDMGHGTFDI
jgi:hypothetical protein